MKKPRKDKLASFTATGQVDIIGGLDGRIGWCMASLAFKPGERKMAYSGVKTDLQNKMALSMIIANLQGFAMKIAAELNPKPVADVKPEKKIVLPGFENTPAPVQPFQRGITGSGKAMGGFKAMLNAGRPILPSLEQMAAQASEGKPYDLNNPWNSKELVDRFSDRIQDEWPREAIGQFLLGLRLPHEEFSMIKENIMMFVLAPERAATHTVLMIEKVVTDEVFDRLRGISTPRPH